MSSRPLSYSGSGIYLPRSTASRAAENAPREIRGPLARGAFQRRLRPFAFWLLIAVVAGMAVWTITTATYFAFRENVLTRLIARQAEMQFGYEDRIAELRAQVDRITSRQLLDQEQYEQKVEQLLRRQTALESRTNTLGGFGDATSSIKQPARSAAPEGPGHGQLKLSPTPKKGALLAPRLDAGPLRSATDHNEQISAGSGLSHAISQAEASLDRMEQRQAAALDSLEQSYQARAQRIRGVLAELGMETGKLERGERVIGVGGPFVPARIPKDAGNFERQLYRVSIARIQMASLARALDSVPVRKPLNGEIDLMSGFGIRQDPFTGSPAMHTGIDLHGRPGDPVRASADGTVTAAGWSGGYGRVVDIDHGNGLSTRYAHLSAVDVQVGQRIKSGQTVGRLGSTGRSTGPHLHYETRVKGEAVDPQKFLRAETRLGSI